MAGKLSLDTFLSKGTTPPRYTTHGAGPSTSTTSDRSDPPPYHLEQVRIPVGGKVPEVSFVTASQLKTHLGLLRAFKKLKDRVTDVGGNQGVRDKLPQIAQELWLQERWTWFLELALERSVMCDSCTCLAFAESCFEGSIAGCRTCLLFSSRIALSTTLPWTCGSSGTRTC